MVLAYTGDAHESIPLVFAPAPPAAQPGLLRIIVVVGTKVPGLPMYANLVTTCKCTAGSVSFLSSHIQAFSSNICGDFSPGPPKNRVANALFNPVI
jgi:hypothetical protein